VAAFSIGDDFWPSFIGFAESHGVGHAAGFGDHGMRI